MSKSTTEKPSHQRRDLLTHTLTEELDSIYAGCSCSRCQDSEEALTSENPFKPLYDSLGISEADLRRKFEFYHAGTRTIIVDKKLNRNLEPREVCPCSHPETPVLFYLRSIIDAEVAQLSQRTEFNGREFFLVSPSNTVNFSDLSRRDSLSLGAQVGRIKRLDGPGYTDIASYRVNHLGD